MPTLRRTSWPIGLALALLLAPATALPDPDLAQQAVPSGAKCPVCGMFVAKYPEWVALAVWQDGYIAYFDGAKELFRLLAQPERFAPGRDPSQIASMFVTDYYNLKRIPARAAWYVLGSDVHGPMGHELIPLATEQEAHEFMHDHAGRTILRFDQITPQILSTLENMGGTP